MNVSFVLAVIGRVAPEAGSQGLGYDLLDWLLSNVQLNTNEFGSRVILSPT